jgi:putative spermidine/putrescine transport system ATP-binding protein
MRDGRIEQVGPAQEVYEQPATRFVAEFVGSSNVLAGEAARAVFGDERAVSVRPEKVRVLSGDQAPAAEDVRVEAVVREVVYAGAETRVVAEAHGTTLTALVLNDTAGAHPARRGDRVTLAWSREATTQLHD